MEEGKRNTFPKKVHLCGKVTIADLFKHGKAFLSYPVKVTYQSVKSEVPVSLLVVAPKKKFKHAVDRNRVKRQLREAYRKNNEGLLNAVAEKGICLNVAMLYVDDQLLPSHVIEKKIKSALAKLTEKISQEDNASAQN